MRRYAVLRQEKSFYFQRLMSNDTRAEYRGLIDNRY